MKDRIELLMKLGLTEYQATKFCEKLAQEAWGEALSKEYNGNSVSFDDWFNKELAKNI